jgi:hypothetical protein
VEAKVLTLGALNGSASPYRNPNDAPWVDPMAPSLPTPRAMNTKSRGGDSREATVRDEKGGSTETWTMDKAKRGRTAETPKQPILGLQLRAPYLYPDRRTISPPVASIPSAPSSVVAARNERSLGVHAPSLRSECRRVR